MSTKNALKGLALSLAAMFLAASADAVNKIPLKPDGTSAAPCTVYGQATPGLSCGKTTAPAYPIDVAGSVLVSAFYIPTKTQVGTAETGTAGIYISTTIPATSAYETLLSSGTNILLTSLPTISTNTSVGGTTGLPDGIEMVVTSTAAETITLQDNGTLTGSLLELGAASRAISVGKFLKLKFVSATSKWYEVSYGNN